MRAILLSLSGQWIQNLPCQRDPRSKNGREVTEGREMGLGLIDNISERQCSSSERTGNMNS